MSVSNLHGGGITLQRVIGDDLEKIKHFLHSARFARDLPPVPEISARTKYMINRFEEDSSRRWLGSRPSGWLSRTHVVKTGHARHCASLVDNMFPGRGLLRALVCPQDQTSIRIIEVLKARRPIKYITWIMDDYLVRRKAGRWTYPFGLHQAMANHLRDASQIFVISPTMRDFYRSEFGVESEVLFGPADPVEEPVWVPPVSGNICRLGYFGSIGSWQRDALAKLGRHLRSLNATLDIFTNGRELPSELQLAGVNLHKMVPSASVIHAMRQYDGVVLPISFLDSMRHLTDFNIATKMSECLASGTVTLVVGPENAAMVRFLAPHGAACLTTANDLAEVRSAVANLTNESYRRKVLASARELVRFELSTRLMRARWNAGVSKLEN